MAAFPSNSGDHSFTLVGDRDEFGIPMFAEPLAECVGRSALAERAVVQLACFGDRLGAQFLERTDARACRHDQAFDHVIHVDDRREVLGGIVGQIWRIVSGLNDIVSGLTRHSV